MATDAQKQTGVDPALEDIVADADTGGRMPDDQFGRRALWILPLCWAIYQLWIASPLPFWVGYVWNDTQTRSIHLGFAVLLAFLAFPYVTLMVGLMNSVPAASHSEHSTKMTVVVTLWLVTSYLMLHVSSILKNVFSVFSVWHRLMALFDAYDDVRVPRFQTYIHIFAYAFTCLWGIARAALCFKYNVKLRKALGP